MDTVTLERAEVPPPEARTPRVDGIGAVRWLVATCSLTAAGIHFGFAPAHLSEDWAHGLFFISIAWLQVATGILAITHPRRALWVAAIVLNVGVVAVWVVSRTSGVPFGPEALRTEDVGTPDLLASSLEAAIIALAIVALRVPSVLRSRATPKRSLTALTAASALAIVVAGSVSLTPRFAGAHSHAASAAAGTSPCEKSGPPASPGQVEVATDGHNHRGPTAQVEIDQPTRTALEAQQVQARTVATKYPTVADAEAAGYHMSTPYVPCIGAHYTNIGLVGSFDPAAPSELLFDGTTPTSKIVGLSYLVFHRGGAPEGFAGPNDHWHQHNANGGLCFGNGVVIGGEELTQDQCKAIGGSKRELTDIWMLHDWTVPGWECSWGVFAGECPELGGRTGGSAWDAPDPATAGALGGS